MPFYTGKSADGSDAVEVKGAGVYANPDNPNEWSSTMYPSQRKQAAKYDALMNYMSGKYTLNDVYQQIQAKTCPLSKNLRDYVLSHYDINGNFIESE